MRRIVYGFGAVAVCLAIYFSWVEIVSVIVGARGHLARAGQVSGLRNAAEDLLNGSDFSQRRRPTSAGFCPSETSINFAKAAQLIWFNPNLSGGAHTWVFNGAEVIKGLAAYCGSPRLIAEIFFQIKNVLDPAKGPTATGGYQDQKQLGIAFMFFLAKRTPEIWSSLSKAQQEIIDLEMEALMYSSVFTTKDEVSASLGMNGDTNLNRDWNPNYQNGMVGMIIIQSLYWGFDQFESKLAAYDDAAFVDKLRANNMKNLLSTYENSARPPAAVVQDALRKMVNGAIYRFHGITERNVMGLFNYIASRTFSAEINCGLNGGSGIGGYGKMMADCDQLPNVGRKGMLLEFDGWDAGGRRSSAFYAWSGWYTLNYVRAALQIEGWLTPLAVQRSATLSDTMRRYFIGTNDLWFKISPDEGGGYKNYEKGRPGGTFILDERFKKDFGAGANLDLFNLLQRNLGLPTVRD